jgi:hypothetical protein
VTTDRQIRARSAFERPKGQQVLSPRRTLNCRHDEPAVVSGERFSHVAKRLQLEI